MSDLDIRARKLGSIWASINIRCYDANSSSYKDYGARGIKVKWLGFDRFIEDMLPSYETGLTLDRIDNNGNYSKDNCRWATMKQQANNRRSNRFITHNGETMTVAEWANKLGIRLNTVYQRLSIGWGEIEAITTPVKMRKNLSKENLYV